MFWSWCKIECAVFVCKSAVNSYSNVLGHNILARITVWCKLLNSTNAIEKLKKNTFWKYKVFFSYAFAILSFCFDLCQLKNFQRIGHWTRKIYDVFFSVVFSFSFVGRSNFRNFNRLASRMASCVIYFLSFHSVTKWKSRHQFRNVIALNTMKMLIFHQFVTVYAMHTKHWSHLN